MHSQSLWFRALSIVLREHEIFASETLAASRFNYKRTRKMCDASEMNSNHIGQIPRAENWMIGYGVEKLCGYFDSIWRAWNNSRQKKMQQIHCTWLKRDYRLKTFPDTLCAAVLVSVSFPCSTIPMNNKIKRENWPGNKIQRVALPCLWLIWGGLFNEMACTQSLEVSKQQEHTFFIVIIHILAFCCAKAIQ